MNSADCEFVDRLLDAWVAGRLPVDAAGRLEAHLRSCERCRRLERIVRGVTSDDGWAETLDEGDADGAMFAEVMSRTSGGACTRAEALLPDLVDGTLERSSAEILGDHVRHCPPCARLLGALQETSESLPALAEIEPPLGFTARVLAATSRSSNRSSLAEWWLRVLARPRASVELAYAGALLIVVLVGNPVAAFHGAEDHARRLVGSVPVERIADRLPETSGALGMVTSAFRALTDDARAIGAELSARWLQAKALLASVQATIADAARWVVNFDWRHPFTGARHSLQPGNKAPPAAQPTRSSNRTVGDGRSFTA